MTKQPEALRLADLQNAGCFEEWSNTAKELRRLHEVNQELLEALNTWLEQYSAEEYEDCPEVVQTRATIAKATGESND